MSRTVSGSTPASRPNTFLQAEENSRDKEDNAQGPIPFKVLYTGLIKPGPTKTSNQRRLAPFLRNLYHIDEEKENYDTASSGHELPSEPPDLPVKNPLRLKPALPLRNPERLNSSHVPKRSGLQEDPREDIFEPLGSENRSYLLNERVNLFPKERKPSGSVPHITNSMPEASHVDKNEQARAAGKDNKATHPESLVMTNETVEALVHGSDSNGNAADVLRRDHALAEPVPLYSKDGKRQDAETVGDVKRLGKLGFLPKTPNGHPSQKAFAPKSKSFFRGLRNFLTRK